MFVAEVGSMIVSMMYPKADCLVHEIKGKGGKNISPSVMV